MPQKRFRQGLHKLANLIADTAVNGQLCFPIGQMPG